MSEEALTFSDLRKIEKQEKRQEELSELEDDFLLKVSQYLERKKGADRREYKNAKRVFEKIIGMRQDKIVKNAKISVKTDVKSSKLNLLPREQEFFREVKDKFNAYSQKIDEVVEKEPDNIESKELEDDVELETDIEEEQNDEEEELVAQDGYEVVKITSEVPEFMGTDLESYGPFDEGEQVEIPEENADILVNRGSAEQVT